MQTLRLTSTCRQSNITFARHLNTNLQFTPTLQVYEKVLRLWRTPDPLVKNFDALEAMSDCSDQVIPSFTATILGRRPPSLPGKAARPTF